MANDNDIIDLFEGMWEDEPAAQAPKPVETPSKKEASKKTKPKKAKTNKTAETPKAPKVDGFEKAISAYFEQECITDPDFAAKYRNGKKTAKDACKWLKDYHKKHAVGGCYVSDNDADNRLAKKFIMDDNIKSNAESKAIKDISDAVKDFKPSMTAEELPDDADDESENVNENNSVIDLFENM